MNALTLYQLSEQYRALERLADSDEIPPEVIRDTLDALSGELDDKAVSVAHFIRNLESAAESIAAAAGNMMIRADRLRDRAHSVREYLLFHMQATNKQRIDSVYFTLSVRNNPPAVVVDDETAVPVEFKVQPPAPAPRLDRTMIAAHLKAGETVPGCHIVTRQRLEIKI